MLANPVTIIDSSNWSEALSAILSGFRYLDSIVLFDVGNVYLTVLGFDIAVFVFGIVWNTAGLWHYDFDESIAGMDSSPPFDGGKDYGWITVDDGEDDPPEYEPEIDIYADDDDDYN